MLTTLTNVCTTHHTYGPLQDLLLEAVRQWLYPGPVSHDTFPQGGNYALELRPLIHAQTRIGWRHLFNGRFCQQWADIQNTHLYNIRHHLTTKNNSGQKWQVVIISVLWEEWHNLWVMRNADVHGKDEATRALAEKREVHRKLASIYDQRNHMEPSAQALLFPDIRTHMQQPSWVIQTCLTIKGPTFIQSLRNVKTKAIQNVRSIREYYAPVQG